MDCSAARKIMVSKPMRTHTLTAAIAGFTSTRLCSHFCGGMPTNDRA
jgi:histone acetyltransferase (RNA polymerase elongator complex component)